MEKYIITFEHGVHFVTNEITEGDIQGMLDGLLSIIRCSDAKELSQDNEWNDLTKWENL